MKASLLLAIGGAATLAACAPTAPASEAPGAAATAQARASAPRRCFSASNVSGYREVGEEALNLRIGANQIWRLDFAGRCPEVKWSIGGIGLQQRGSTQICDGLDVDVLTNDAGFIRRCLVEDVRRLSQAEAAALPDNQRP